MTILDEIRAENADLRRAMEKGFDSIEKRFDLMEKRFDSTERGIDARFDRVDARIAALEVKIADVKSDLMKWSFVFWCGAVFAVATLAGVLRQ